MATSRVQPSPKGTGIVESDSWLKPYMEQLRHRYEKYVKTIDEITQTEGSVEDFTRGHEYYGLNRGHRDSEAGVWYREWAPGADALFLIGDFNGWNRQSHPMARDDFGVWSIFLPDRDYAETLTHGSRVKVHVHSGINPIDRVPAYIRRAMYEPQFNILSGQYWNPPDPFRWDHPLPKPDGAPRIYEAHVGMAQEEQRVGTYTEFAHRVLPRIARAGYNVVQLMAIQEHPYYASFGYQVSSFFAPSSRFGTPEDLKHLIDVAHGLGLRVFIDLVHSHAVKNIYDGLNKFDGTDHQYFHAGARGRHPAWDSRLFDYGRHEVLRFLLSNVRYWLEEFRFDGIRFDGVTSMMYQDHGLGKDFTSYADYFDDNVDADAITYLQLANRVAHDTHPQATTVAEDVSGLVGIARPIDEGGIGFDYRLAMGIPDYWIKILKEKRDEEWSMGELYHTLINRRKGEKHIAYSESHDQALVGDKTIAFRLMGADMYWLMSKATPSNMVIERGIALANMIRLITFALGGEGYLNFMGNEFGHPEWIDFPREGNNQSYLYARRQWSLVDDALLRYRDLANFDRCMQALDIDYHLLSASMPVSLQNDEDRKLVLCYREPLLFAFNFHHQQSYPDLRIGAPLRTDYRLILNTDAIWFGGHGIVTDGQRYPIQNVPCHEQDQSVQIYLPARSAQVLGPCLKTG